MKKFFLFFVIIICGVFAGQFVWGVNLFAKESKQSFSKTNSSKLYCVNCNKLHVVKQGTYCLTCNQVLPYGQKGSKCQLCGKPLIAVISCLKPSSKSKQVPKKQSKKKIPEIYNIDVQKVKRWQRQKGIILMKINQYQDWQAFKQIYFCRSTYIPKRLNSYPKKVSDEKNTKSFSVGIINGKPLFIISGLFFRGQKDPKKVMGSRIKSIRVVKGFKVGLLVLSSKKIFLVFERSFLQRVWKKFDKTGICVVSQNIRKPKKMSEMNPVPTRFLK